MKKTRVKTFILPKSKLETDSFEDIVNSFFDSIPGEGIIHTINIDREQNRLVVVYSYNDSPELVEDNTD